MKYYKYPIILIFLYMIYIMEMMKSNGWFDEIWSEQYDLGNGNKNLLPTVEEKNLFPPNRKAKKGMQTASTPR